MLIHVITQSPTLGPPAYQVNVFCGVCTLLAAYLMGKVVKQSNPKYWEGSIFSMCMFALSPLIWQYGVTAEVFPLNTLFAASIIYLVTSLSRLKRFELCIFLAFWCGLALTNQHTIVLFVAPLACWVVFLLRHAIKSFPLILVYLSVAALVGLSPYLYLPIAAAIKPVAGSWGHVTSVGGLLHHLLRKDYGTFQLFSGAAGKKTESMISRSIAYLKDATFVQGLYVTPGLAIVGISAWIALSLPKRSGTSNKIVGMNSKKLSGNARSSKASKHLMVKTNLTEGAVTLACATTDNSANAPQSSSSSSSSEWWHVSSFDRFTCYFHTSDDCYTPLVLCCTQVFYFVVFHSLSNLPLSDKLLYGVHQVNICAHMMIAHTIRLCIYLRFHH